MDSLSDIAYEYFVEFETEKSCPHHFEGDPSILLFFQSWGDFSVYFLRQNWICFFVCPAHLALWSILQSMFKRGELADQTQTGAERELLPR